jgi:hypothetical protein
MGELPGIAALTLADRIPARPVTPDSGDLEEEGKGGVESKEGTEGKDGGSSSELRSAKSAASDTW